MKLFRNSFYIMAVFLMAACIDDLTTLNTNPKSYSDVPAETLYTNAVRNLTDGVVYGVTFKVLAQQWSETTYTDASRYNLPNIGNGYWNTLYRDVLMDLKEAKALVTAETAGFAEVKANKLALIDIMEVYTYALLVNAFGDIPYSEALDFKNPQPKYDDAKGIYTDLFARLDADVAAMNASFGSFGDADLVYGGSVSSWIKFANSLRLRMAMTLSDVDNATAKTQAEKAFAAGVFTSNDDNALFAYLDVSPNTNPIWVNLVQSGREDYVASNTMVNLMQSINATDPRLPQYFTTVGGYYSGGTFGTSNNFGNFSHASAKMVAQGFPGTLLDFSEVSFYLAEAKLKGYSVGSATVADYYHEAIKASIISWGGSEADADTYLADADVDFATAAGTDIQKIATQKYIALYNRGVEAWTEYRRLDYPVLNTVPSPLGDFPIRYSYPVNEQNLNQKNWEAAAKAIGGDEVTTQVFWDVN